MGGKASNYMQQDRPESGGADRNDLQEKSGLLEREKQEFAASEQAKKSSDPEEQANKGDRTTGDKGELQQ